MRGTTTYIDTGFPSSVFTGEGKYCITTYGCQMNAHDSEILSGMLQSMGYEAVQDEKDADIIVYNTCCIRETAERRVFGNVGWLKALKREKPHVKIIVCGCMMQQEGMAEHLHARYDFVDIVFGTYAMQRLPYMLRDAYATGKFICDTDESYDIYENMPQYRKLPFHGYVNIMYGCNNFCSYCIVPHVRGRERSRRMEDILREAEDLLRGGAQEIMLLGQNVNSYGNDLEEEASFAQLLRELDALGIPRLRFMTSHPKDLTEEVLSVMAGSKHIASQLHLPIQSGSDAILRAMNRKYTVESYSKILRAARALMPDIGLSTDIIVGFPGETEEDFEKTLDFMRETRYDSAFTFVFSPRTGTPAADMPEQIAQDVKSRRIERLIAAQTRITNEIHASLVGTEGIVLVEGTDQKRPGMVSGKTERGNHVHLPGGEDAVGKMIPVRITACENGNKLKAERTDNG